MTAEVSVISRQSRSQIGASRENCVHPGRCVIFASDSIFAHRFHNNLRARHIGHPTRATRPRFLALS
jgi:hypothetical protein